MADKKPNAIITQRIEVTKDLIKLRVVPDGWELPDFEPGQYVTLGMPATSPRSERADVEERPPKNPDRIIMRAYSIASSSIAREYIELYIGMVHTGSLSPRLFELKPDDNIWMSTTFRGMFTLREVPPEFNSVLIATGTGVAPYMSMIRTELSSGLKRRFAVFHGAYHSYDLGYHSELSALAAVSENFSYFPTLSHAHEEKTPWNGHEGFVQKLWTDSILEKEWGIRPTSENTHIFLCGNPYMIEEMTELLKKEGFQKHSKKNPGQIHSEQYFVKL
ncbi:MAG: ferredoxin--NADP reductase [candidate division Zixibacteria bacterium]